MKAKMKLLVIFILALGLLLNTCAPLPLPTARPNAEVTVTPLGITLDLQKVDDHPLYVLHYNGDYGFDEYLETGQRPKLTTFLPAWQKEWACTVFAALNPAGEQVLGRNFDWEDHPALFLFTAPPNGYRSVAMVDISYLGFSKTAPITDQNRSQLLNAPYLPFDGMNEKGLAVGMMAVSDIQPVMDSAKVTIDSLAVIRLLLDKAASVEEALALLEQYNVNFSGGPVIHYLIADASGHSAVVEYGDARQGQPARFVFPNDQPWQVSTNFEFAPQPPTGADSSCWRYNLAYETLSAAEGKITQPGAMTLLQSVSQPSTLWSVTYNLRSGQIEVSLRRHYDQVYRFQLDVAK
jgi:hypothetical protein